LSYVHGILYILYNTLSCCTASRTPEAKNTNTEKTDKNFYIRIKHEGYRILVIFLDTIIRAKSLTHALHCQEAYLKHDWHE